MKPYLFATPVFAALVLLGFHESRAGEEIHKSSAGEKFACSNTDSCVGMAIDSGDPVLIQMGHEMSDMVSAKRPGTVVKPTAGPIANVARMMSTENAGLSIVPSDMLLYTSRSKNWRLRLAKARLRFVMTIGRKVVHVIARKNIRNLADLDGKRVVMGPDNTALWVVSNNLLHIHKATPSKRMQLKPPAGIAAVLASKADAVFVIGDAPLGIVKKLGALRASDKFGSDAKELHLLEVKVPSTASEYRPATVRYPGFAERVETVAILPTLVSYDFTHRATPYFQSRCVQLGRIGWTVRKRLKELRKSGHKQWKATEWALEAGKWQKDLCFFSNYRRDIRQVQRALNNLGYDVGAVDGVLGPRTSEAIKRYQADRRIKKSGTISPRLLSLLRKHARRKN